MSLQDSLRRLAAIKIIGDYIKALDATAKAELLEEVGTRMGATAALVDGEEVATVSVAQGRYPRGVVDGWYVSDERAFLEWVRQVRPTAIVETVRESDRKSLLGGMKRWLEEHDGEVPPGVDEAERGDSYVLVNQSEEQRAAAVEAWHSGRLGRPELAGYDSIEAAQ